jgi:hypothetical protein
MTTRNLPKSQGPLLLYFQEELDHLARKVEVLMLAIRGFEGDTESLECEALEIHHELKCTALHMAELRAHRLKLVG